ncbi:hypothetical protein GGF32_007902 [Allomyces javanicus]|nr:hypothetical protein GGF32_007902 [Allomyces javanicus]
MSFPTNQPDYHHAAAADATDADVVMAEAAPLTNAHWSTSHIFLGTTGAGKSTLANAVAGVPVFATGLCAIGITQDVQSHDLAESGGVRLIDTPGIDVDDINSEADVAHLLARVPHGRPTSVVLVVQIGGEQHKVSDEDRELARIVQAKVAAMAGSDARCAVVFNCATLAARKAIKADLGSFLRQVFDEGTIEDVGTVPSTVVPWSVDAAGDVNVMLPPNVQTDLRAFVESLPLMMLEPSRITAVELQAPQPAHEEQRDIRNEPPSPALPSWFAPSLFSHAPAAAPASSSTPVAAAATPPPPVVPTSTRTPPEWPATMPHVQYASLLPTGPPPLESSPTPTTLTLFVAAPSPPHAERAFADRDSALGAMYSPPKEILFHGTLAQAQYQAYKDQKWLLVDVYDPTNLVSLARSRDVWHNETVKSIVLDQFIFIQVPVYENAEGAEHVVIYAPSTGKRLAMIGGERDRTVIKYRKAALLNDPNDVAEFLLEFTSENGMPDEKGGVSVRSGVLAGASMAVPAVGTTTVGEQVPRPGLQDIEERELQTALWASLQERSSAPVDAQASSSGAFPVGQQD